MIFVTGVGMVGGAIVENLKCKNINLNCINTISLKAIVLYLFILPFVTPLIRTSSK